MALCLFDFGELFLVVVLVYVLFMCCRCVVYVLVAFGCVALWLLCGWFVVGCGWFL